MANNLFTMAGHRSNVLEVKEGIKFERNDTFEEAILFLILPAV